MSYAPSTDIILLGLFGAAFIVFIASSFGIGKSENDGDETAKSYAISGLAASVVSMTGIWLFKHGISIPKVSDADGIFSQIYSFLLHLMPVTAGMTTLSASSYGLGKHDKNRDSQEFTASLAFFAIGLSLSILTLGAWNAGNLSVAQCTHVVVAAKKLRIKAVEATERVGKLNTANEVSDIDAISSAVPK